MPVCAALAAMRDLDDIYEHLNMFCYECVDVQLREAANGQELIFTDGPPSWIVAKQAREAEAKAEQLKANAAARKRKEIEERKGNNGEEPKVNWASADEVKKAEIRKMAGQMSDKHLEHQITVLLRVDDAQAAQMRLDLKRELALKRREAEAEQKKEEMKEIKEQIKAQKEEQKKNPNAPKELNKFQKRPWQPQIQEAIAIADERRSALSMEEQKRYAAILTNFHTVDKHARFEQNKQDLKMYDERLAAERAIVDAMVRERLEQATVGIQEVGREAENVLIRWQSRYLNDQRRYERVKQIPWSREAETLSNMTSSADAPRVLKPNLERLLMAAPYLKLALPPTMHDRLPVAYNFIRFAPRTKKQTTIANDNTLRGLCLDNACTFAMDATTAVHLMTRPGEPRNYAYNVPVTVCDQFRDGSIVRQCFLEKPRPQAGVTNRTLLEMVAKYRAKSTFTQQAEEAHHAKPSSSKVTVASASSSSDTVATTSSVKSEEAEKGGEAAATSTFSLIDNLLGSMTSSSMPYSSVLSSTSAGGGAPPAKASPTAHSYGVFTIPSYSQAETKVLIRHAPCARNAATGGTEYAVAAKVELAADAGVTKETFEEMLWKSMKTVFKGAVNSATIHMHPDMKDALQISHSRAVPQGNQYNQGFHPLLSTRTEHLSRLLAELQQLPTGDYVLQVSPTSDVMTLFKENPRGNETFKMPSRISGSIIRGIDNFTEIDDKRVLHWQVMQGRAPLSLWPEGHQMLATYEKAKDREPRGGMGGGQRKRQRLPPWAKPKSEMTDEEKTRRNFLAKQSKKRNAAAKRQNREAQQGEPPMKKFDDG